MTCYQDCSHAAGFRRASSLPFPSTTGENGEPGGRRPPAPLTLYIGEQCRHTLPHSLAGLSCNVVNRFDSFERIASFDRQSSRNFVKSREGLVGAPVQRGRRAPETHPRRIGETNRYGHGAAVSRQTCSIVSHETPMPSFQDVVQVQSCLLTPAAVAQRLCISRRTLERLVERDLFPKPINLGRAVRFLESDLQAHLAELRAARRKHRK